MLNIYKQLLMLLKKKDKLKIWDNFEIPDCLIASQDLLKILKFGDVLEVKTGTTKELLNYDFNKVKSAAIIAEVTNGMWIKNGLDMIKPIAERLRDETMIIWSVKGNKDISDEKIHLFLVK